MFVCLFVCHVLLIYPFFLIVSLGSVASFAEQASERGGGEHSCVLFPASTVDIFLSRRVNGGPVSGFRSVRVMQYSEPVSGD